MQNLNRTIEYFVFILITAFLYFSENLFWSSVGIAMFVMFSLRLFNNLGNNIDIRDLIIVLSTLQWIIGPFLAYRFYISELNTYEMITPESVYMAYVVPATGLFAFGMFIPLKMKSFKATLTLNQISETVQKHKNIDLLFITTGLIMNMIWHKMPSQLMFISFLFGNLHFIGLLFLLRNKDRKNRMIYLVFTFIFTFVASLNAGMFHDLILWMGFMFLFIAYIKQFSIAKKLSIILVMSFSIVVIQTVKAQFRTIIWSEAGQASSGEKAEIFYDLVSENVGGIFFTSQANINNLVSRINQGWIISRVMHHVPQYEPFADGETIYAGLASTLVPRFIYNSKASAGGVKNFERFTGHKLQPGTSMNLSILGEAYANFGANDAILFMFIFGLFLNYSYALIKQKIIKYPTLLFFIPIIYLQVVKAETDFVTVLNHLIKATVFVALIYWGLKQFLGIKL